MNISCLPVHILFAAGLLLTALQAAEGDDPLRFLARLTPADGIALVQKADAELFQTPADFHGWEQRLLAGLMESAATDYGCQTVCQRLACFASAASVPVLAPWLNIPGRSHAARMVLQMMPGHEATKALIKALETSKGELRCGIIASLGLRGDAHAVSALAPLAHDKDAATAEAALRALGGIGDITAIIALRALPPSRAGDEALIAAAKCRSAACDMALAMDLYRELADPARASAVRGLALTVMAGSAGETLITQLFIALNSNQPDLVTGAIRGLITVSGADLTHDIARRLNNLSDELKVAVCDILAQRRDPQGADAVAALLKATSVAVRQAAIAALAIIGGERQLDALLEMGQDTFFSAHFPKAVHATVVEMVPRTTIDLALLSRLNKAVGESRRLLLGILCDRRCSALVPILLAEARSNEPTCRSPEVWKSGNPEIVWVWPWFRGHPLDERHDHRITMFFNFEQRTSNVERVFPNETERIVQALNFLGELATMNDVPALFDLLAAGQDDRSVVDAIATVLRRHPDNEQTPIILNGRWSTATPEQKRHLLRLAAVAGTCLPHLRNALTDPALADAALLAAAAWPSAVIAEDLAVAISRSHHAANRLIGLRGLGRILELADCPTRERAAQLLHLALGTHANTEEKRSMLASLAHHPDEKSLEIALDFYADQNVQAEVQTCLLTLVKALIDTPTIQMRPVLLKLQKSPDQAVKKEVARLLALLEKP